TKQAALSLERRDSLETEQRVAEAMEDHLRQAAPDVTPSRFGPAWTPPLPSQAEYDALMALYQSTGGPDWTDNTGWRNADPNVRQSVSGWKGLKVLTNGGIEEIQLPGNNLKGPLPEEIG